MEAGLWSSLLLEFNGLVDVTVIFKIIADHVEVTLMYFWRNNDKSRQLFVQLVAFARVLLSS